MNIIFSENYTIEIEHRLKTVKFLKTAQMLLKKKIVKKEEIIEPELPEERDLLAVHGAGWVKKILDLNLAPADILKAEMPVTRDTVFAHLIHTGGTIKAAELALETGLGAHCGGGAHHAHRNYGAGFCLINDIAVAVRKLFRENKIKKAMIVDLDVHQGDGTAEIFKGDKGVFTFSMHQADIYPFKKEKSSLDLELKAGTGGAEYLSVLEKKLPSALDSFKPDFLVYNAGADVYEKDLLGGLSLKIGEIESRDRFVFGLARKKGLPIASVLSGGYAKKLEETVLIHFNTIKSAKEIFFG